ncbi:MAG TPA: DnaJ domain-containing protein [Thermoanaerobaculia bacterium]|jgi:tetratricopeptide (TPR) repeat protein|nr:DnaJ domain-containing protein [Thermoanaerobaculia bacterium]
MADTPDRNAGVLVAPDLMARFEARFGEDLAERPQTLQSEELRAEIGRLLPRAGAASHYELLGISVGAAADEVHRAFTALARRVHPSLAERLNLPPPVLRLLFEHAVQAYLVLSDPDRRRAYDRDNRERPELAPRSDEELAEVRRDMARKAYQRARGLFKAEQYHYVVELMRDAVQWDPRPETYALLGEALAKNPRWQQEGLEQLQQAIRLSPREGVYRLKLAQVLEEMQRPEEAAVEYRAVLEKVPNQPDAVAALERLGAPPPASANKGGGWFR